jgi:uncharacterized protein YcbK (DUF882 family)
MAPPPAIPKWPTPEQPRQIWLKRSETGESCVSRYYDGQRLDLAQYTAACIILRDVRSGAVAHIAVELLDMIYAMQQWLVSWGVDQPLLVNSGYRSKATNDRLLREGAARNSLHLRGLAVDFRIRGMSNEYLGRLAAILRAGGVGFYPSANFVHADVGPVRYWRV